MLNISHFWASLQREPHLAASHATAGWLPTGQAEVEAVAPAPAASDQERSCPQPAGIRFRWPQPEGPHQPFLGMHRDRPSGMGSRLCLLEASAEKAVCACSGCVPGTHVWAPSLFREGRPIGVSRVMTNTE